MKYLLFSIAISLVFQAQSQNYAKVDSFVNYLAKNKQFMGAIALKEVGKQAKVYTTGFVEMETGAPVNQSTTFRIGSVTKMFTSVMILQLQEEGKLSISDKLSKYYPEFPSADKISIKNMLYHESGIHNFTDEEEYFNYMESPQTREEMLSRMLSYPLDFNPGEKHSYSNSNYVLLGYIIEQATGSVYKTELENRIVKPLGLKSTKSGFPGDAEKEEALSFVDGSVKWLPSPETHLSIPHGAGMIVSTPADVAGFVEGLFQGKLLADSSLDAMTRMDRNFGMGIFFMPFFDKKGYGHTGGIDGFVSIAIHFPKDSLSLAICLNGLRYGINDITAGVINSFYDRPFEWPDFTRKTVELTEGQLKRFEGKYVSDEFPLGIKVFYKDGMLNAQADGQSSFPVSATSESEFIFDPAGIRLIFSVDAEKKFLEKMILEQLGKSFTFSREK